MNYFTRVLIAAAAVIFLVLGAASPALASTSSLPRIQTYGMGGSWHDGGWRIRPHLVAFGAHFLIKKLSYRHYNQRDAYGHGRLLIDNCRPSCVVGGYWVRASAYFYGTRHHAGIGPYYGHLRLRWRHNAKSHSKLLWIDQSVGGWLWR